jgi:SAM-dependent methyltransferase
MDLKEQEILGDLQDQHWYYVSKACALARSVADRPPSRILDVGAGSGYFSRMLLKAPSAVRATCVDTGYAADRNEMSDSKPIAFRRNGSDPDADLVLLMDVLEHVDDDVALLREYVQAAKRGTRFVVSVPAFEWLWSGHDEFLEHRRRYTLAAIRRVMRDAGLTAVSGFYFFASIFPAVAVQRLAGRVLARGEKPGSDLRRHHPITNRMLTAIGLLECRVARYNRAFGLTAFAVGEKP